MEPSVLEPVPERRRPNLSRWITGTFIVLISWLVIGSALTIAIASYFDLDLNAITGTDDARLEILKSYPPWQPATAILVSFIPLLVAPILLYRFLLKAPIRELFTRSRRSFGREVLIGAAIMSLLLVGTSIPDLLLSPENYEWSYDPSKFFPYLAIAFTLIPIQTTAEEVFFRGWIQQRLENVRRSIWLVSILGGALFALPHLGNPEVNGGLALPILGYGATGFMFTWVTMRDRSMGVAVGAHGANNILSGLMISSADSALPSASIWTTPAILWAPAAATSILLVPFFIWLSGKWNAKVAS